MKENADRARALDTNEINRQLHDSAEQMFRLKFQLRMGQMEGLKKLRSLRRERARMLTVLRERELHLEPAVHPAPAASGQVAPRPVESEPAPKKKAAAAPVVDAKPAKAKPAKAKKAKAEAAHAKAKPAAKKAATAGAAKPAAAKAGAKKAGAKKAGARKASKG